MLEENNKKQVQISYDKSTSQQVFNYLRDEIVSMKLLPGQKIPESSLVKKFGVSRTPIREAIATLVNLGLVEVRPQRGTFVSKLSVSKIIEARFIREALEVAIISHVAIHHTPELIRECEEIIIQQKLANKTQDAFSFQNLDDAFHQKLADFTQFSRASALIKSEKSHMDRVRTLSLKETGGQYNKILKQHTDILNAVKASDPIKAAKKTSTHMHEVLNTLDSVAKMHPDYFE